MNQENIEPNLTLNYAWTEFLCFHGSFFLPQHLFLIFGHEILK